MRKERSVRPKNNAGWENALTVLQEVRPPFIPERAEVTQTVVADLPPGSAGFPPHRHSGPSFYYMLEGELQFELEGEPAASHPSRGSVLGTRRRRYALHKCQQPRRHTVPFRRDVGVAVEQRHA